MGSEPNRFPHLHRQEPRKRWGGCWGAFSCFNSQKGGKRIVPASRIPDGNAAAAAAASQRNGPQVAGLTNGTSQGQVVNLSILAPPSSPASFTHSALPSTAQSPNCYPSLSPSSPCGPSSTMFVTGPYAHETQLVSPPVFSTFTTEPSTAPFTPPPELAHLTTPSSPDVPFARFLTSSKGLSGADKTDYMHSSDLHSPYHGSPASSLMKASCDGLSSSFPERDFPPHWDPAASPQSDKYTRSGSERLYGSNGNGPSRGGTHDTNFFCPATFAEFYLDHNPPFPHTGGRLSVSKDSDVIYPSNQNRQVQKNRSPKKDPEEVEAYRASFGFSADEIITTPQYVEIVNVTADESFAMKPPFGSDNSPQVRKDSRGPALIDEGEALEGTSLTSVSSEGLESVLLDKNAQRESSLCGDVCKGRQPRRISGLDVARINLHTGEEDDDASPMYSREYHIQKSMSDAEIEYRGGRSMGEGRGFIWNC
ncbi:hypothetical protein SAY87_005028 [Trapa incisa]|uniref:Hydroxyproline-rich glycoprotein family protein n=1 Tax=Trapa incisa TaxID=236973 RepID=A0AAN7PNJ6_9MYRT|nr:hypothetical protein SAY87_005028 [Trapa incisa]